MTRLNDVRDDASVYNNRLDTLLADVFNLLSLFFLTIGKTKEAPATYSQLASMRVSIAKQALYILSEIGPPEMLLFPFGGPPLKFPIVTELLFVNSVMQSQRLTPSFSKFSTIWMNHLSTTKVTSRLSEGD